MKKKMKLFLMGAVLTQLLNAQQDWIAENATWYYAYYSFWEGEGYEKISYDGDVLINGKMCKQLNREIYYVDFQSFDTIHIKKNPKFVYQSGDTIWLYKNGNFLQLYNFSLEIGDTVSFMYFPSILNNVNILEDIEEIVLNQTTFRKQRIGVYADGDILGGIEIIDKLGLVSYPFTFFWDEHTPNLPDAGEWFFKCYADINTPEINFTTQPCDELPMVVTNTGTANKPEIIVGPNPVTNQLKIYPEAIKIDQLRILDLDGKIVFEKTANFGNVYLGGLPDGMYFVEILTGEKRVLKKIVKASR